LRLVLCPTAPPRHQTTKRHQLEQSGDGISSHVKRLEGFIVVDGRVRFTEWSKEDGHVAFCLERVEV
jgi:hypothetical protein